MISVPAAISYLRRPSLARTIAFVSAVLIPLWPVVGTAQGPQAAASPEATHAYIVKSWDTLTRTMTECKALTDIKTAGTPILYVPADMAVPAELASLGQRCGVDIEKLPRKVEHFGELKLTDIPHPGLLYLPHPYVVPGGRFNEMYGWDSYFILLGLVADGRIDLARGMTENFLFEIEHYGGILNANRTYYLTRSQPPYLSSMIREVYEAQHDKAWLENAYKWAARDHALWELDIHRAGDTGLARYFDIGTGPVPEMADASSYYPDVIHYLVTHPGAGQEYLLPGPADPTPAQAAQLAVSSCDLQTSTVCRKAQADGERLTADYFVGDRADRESGFDTTFRFGPFSGSTHHYAPVCLNSLLYKYERDMEMFAKILNKPSDATMWAHKAEARHAAMDKYLWDEAAGMYFDYDFTAGHRSTYKYITTFDPLWAGVASKEQAAAVEKHLPDFEHDHGLAMSTTTSGVQWDLPFGWAPCNWPSALGLLKYGYKQDALRIATKWNTNVDSNLATIGTIREKYDVITGSPDSVIKFGYKSNEIGFGWSNGAYEQFRILLAAEAK